MARGLWHYLKNLPPIDWEALAFEHQQKFRYGQKGPQPVEWNRKAHEVRRVNTRRRQKAAEKAARRRLWQERIQGHTTRGTLDAALLGAMEPGQWYGRPDIRVLSGAKRNSVHARLGRYERDGWVERARNPDWTPTETPRGAIGHFRPNDRPPEWLFRLTPLGEAVRRQVAYLA